MDKIQLTPQNALMIVGDSVTPTGMVDFKGPADMIKEMMQRVMDDPKNKDNIAGLQVMVEGGKSIVEAGKAQNDQAEVLVKLLNVNRKLDMI